MFTVKVYFHNEEGEIINKEVKVHFVPRKTDILVIDEIEYEVKQTIIDTDTEKIILNLVSI